MKKTIFYICCILLTAQMVHANSYEVKTEEELKGIIPKLLPGDEVIIANGNYSNWKVEISSKGTIEKPISIRAAKSGKVIFSGEVAKTMFKFTGGYVTFSGIAFTGCILLKNAVLVEFSTTDHCRISECSFTKNQVKAQFMPLVIFSGNGTYNKIDHCDFTGNIDNQDIQVKITKDSFPVYTDITANSFQNKAKVSWANGNGGECVQIGQDPILLGNAAPKTFVTNNKFVHCDAENEVISNKSSSNTYNNNYFENNDGELVMRGGHDCIIDGNTFVGGTGGIRINGTGHQVTNNKITNIKTAIRLMYGMAKGKEETGFYIAASNCTIKGNKISNATTGILVGDSKNADWTGKFDTVRYPSRVMQDVAPFDNKIEDNQFTATKNQVVTQ